MANIFTLENIEDFSEKLNYQQIVTNGGFSLRKKTATRFK